MYGSLAPGRANHHQVAPLGGDWTSGWITGGPVPTGWGAELGYAAIRYRAGGERIPAWLLCSAALPTAWARLDAFEGAAYQRLLAPFETEAGVVAVGYFYAAASGATGSDSPWYAIDYGLAGRGALKAKKTMIRRLNALPLFD